MDSFQFNCAKQIIVYTSRIFHDFILNSANFPLHKMKLYSLAETKRFVSIAELKYLITSKSHNHTTTEHTTVVVIAQTVLKMTYQFRVLCQI